MQSQGGDLFSPYLYRARNGVERSFKKFKLCRRIVQPDQREGYDDQRLARSSPSPRLRVTLPKTGYAR